MPSASLPMRAMMPVRSPSRAAAVMTFASTPPGPERRSRMKTPSSRRGSTETRWVWSTTALPTATRSSTGGSIDVLESQFRGRTSRFLHEATDYVEILPPVMPAEVGTGERVDAVRANMADGGGDIVRAESTGQNYRNRVANAFDDLGANVPVVNDAG